MRLPIRAGRLLIALSTATAIRQSYGEVPYVEAIAVLSGDELTVFAVNRSLKEKVTLSLELTGFGKPALIEHIQLNHTNLKAVNTAEAPENVVPSPGGTRGTKAKLEKHSWNVIRYKIN